MKRLLIALILCAAGLWAQALTTPVNVAPDCLVFFDFTAAPGNGASFDNRFIGCDTWNVSYTNTGFTPLNLYFQDAPDSSGAPGTWATFAGTVVSGVNPNVAVTQASTNFKGYYPWLRVRLDTATGSGRVRGLMYGYRAQPINYVLASVVITSVTADQGAPNTAVNRWPVYLSDGSNPQGTTSNPLVTGEEYYNGATGLWTPVPACTSHAPITLAGAGTTQIVALSGTTQIRVCHLSLSLTGASNITLVQGTGASCGTGTAGITGAYQNILGLALDFEGKSLVTGTAGNALCVTNSAAVTGGGFITYAQY